MYKLNDYYGKEYFGDRMSFKESVYADLATSIQNTILPNSVVDVGCGNGVLSKGFTCEYQGIEGSDEGVKSCKERGVNVIQHDLRVTFRKRKSYDLAISIEVAEHIEEEYADKFLETLTKLSNKIILTASNNKGYSHFNCQPKSYWIDKMEGLGFEYKYQETVKLINELRRIIPSKYSYLYNNMMVFENG